MVMFVFYSEYFHLNSGWTEFVSFINNCQQMSRHNNFKRIKIKIQTPALNKLETLSNSFWCTKHTKIQMLMQRIKRRLSHPQMVLNEGDVSFIHCTDSYHAPCVWWCGGDSVFTSWDDADDLLPESYRINSPDETRLLSIADNFQRQYSYLYPDRKPLLLCSVNESGVKVTQTPPPLFFGFLYSNSCLFSNIQKFASTTVRPTPTPHPELFSWEGCASFVADFLTLDLLEPPTELVSEQTLTSPLYFKRLCGSNKGRNTWKPACDS